METTNHFSTRARVTFLLLAAGILASGGFAWFITSHDAAFWNQSADRQLRLLATTGDLAHLGKARNAITHSLAAESASTNRAGLILRARAALAAHRFEEARCDAGRVRALVPGNSLALRYLGDAWFNLGDYNEAAQVWNELLAVEKSSLVTEPRLAQLDLIFGRDESARQRLEAGLKAARRLTPPAPEIVAWFCVQVGELAFKSGDWDTAGTHYDAALAAQPDYYSALDHQAELRGAQGRYSEAVELYTRLIRRCPRPEFMQARGDLHAFAGQPDAARRWHKMAREAYLASVDQGEIVYFHHLAGFFAASVEEPQQAVEWARRDFALRHGITACDALAWALHKAGHLAEARAMSERALATGTRDPHLLYHAAMIRMAAGDIAGGAALTQQALEANPRYFGFHVHR